MEEPRDARREKPDRPRRPKQAPPASASKSKKTTSMLTWVGLSLGALVMGIGISYGLITYTSFDFGGVFGSPGEAESLTPDAESEGSASLSDDSDTDAPVVGQKRVSRTYAGSVRSDTIGVYDNPHTDNLYDWFVVTEAGAVYLVDGIEETSVKLNSESPIIQSVLNGVLE